MDKSKKKYLNKESELLESTMDDYFKNLINDEETEQNNQSLNSEVIEVKKPENLTPRDAHLASFRGILILIYYHCKAQGFVRTLDFQIFNEIYEYYIGLGGNGVIKALKSKFIEIPFEEDYFEEQKRKKSHKQKSKPKAK